MDPDMKRIGCDDLPPLGSAERVAFLRRLASAAGFSVLPWVEAIEAGAVAPEPDLLRVLAPRLDAAVALRLLNLALRPPAGGEVDPVLLETAGGVRHPRLAARLRSELGAPCDPATASLLVPLLGHQRDPRDFALLQRLALEPGPLSLRHASLEGLARGLPCWPEQDLATMLETLAGDLDAGLAATAVDLLVRLPGGVAILRRLASADLDPQVRSRLERRLRGWPGGPG
jgi:hypothetical protein